ncbi:MAG: DegV family protein [Lachnospiraceae bacterium]|nr:DegV family protein [Lachnospiraceae bacterium]
MIKIISDSTCDLSPELIRRFDIGVLPLNVRLGDKEYQDGVNVTPEQLYEWSDANKTTPKTAAPSVEAAVELFRPYIGEGDEIIAFCISESMSASGNIMRLAAKELEAEEKVHVVDSANLSTGIGLQVLRAANFAAKGASADEILKEMVRINPLVRASFVVDTLTYLRRGGRCSSVEALAGSVLKIKPCIEVADGAMSAAKKYRGNIDKVIMQYVRDLEPKLKNAEPERVFITHSGCHEAVVRYVELYLDSLNIFKEINITRAGSVVSSHCGPGTLGVLFIEKKI